MLLFVSTFRLEAFGGVKMAKCEICDKGILFGRKISITRSQVSRRALAKQQPNVQKIKVIVKDTPVTMKVCTRCLRSGLVKRA